MIVSAIIRLDLFRRRNEKSREFFFKIEKKMDNLPQVLLRIIFSYHSTNYYIYVNKILTLRDLYNISKLNSI